MIRIQPLLLGLLLGLALPAVTAQAQENLDKRQALRDEILATLPADRNRPVLDRIAPHNERWRQWVARTGELPPDFDAMPSLPLLPDPLVMDEGGANLPVRTAEQWGEQRRRLAAQLQHWMTGTFPPAPDNMIAEPVETLIDHGVRVETLRLRFGPERRAQLTVKLMIPPGEGPFPVFLTQWNHEQWAYIAVRRGYIGCIYAGADVLDDTEAYAAIWPEHDFSRLMRRAWGASRAIDYLLTRAEVAPGQIGITGHSRNGKQSLMAAAFDPRIGAVVSSSGGSGGENAWRYAEARYTSESIEEITNNFPAWFHPRLRWFSGREHKLPFDMNSLMALIAPRPLLLSTAFTESQGGPWGIEQIYRSVRTVYDFLGRPGAVSVRMRGGEHGTAARDIEEYVDFFDTAFGRAKLPVTSPLFYPYQFEQWAEAAGESIDPADFPERAPGELTAAAAGASADEAAALQRDIRERLGWLLGEQPAGITHAGPGSLADISGVDDWWTGGPLARPVLERATMKVIAPYSGMGDYLRANVYIPTAAAEPEAKRPALIWLHGFVHQQGFVARSRSLLQAFVDEGFVVLAYDQLGFGTRIEEGTRFYDRYPRWSKMGKMVLDARAAVDVLAGIAEIDTSNIYIAGDNMGGAVALMTAALDERLAGAAVYSGFTPLRTAGPDVEGILAWSHLHGLLPRLGFFVDAPSRIPVDFDELMAAVAPRPLRVIAPLQDRHAEPEQVARAVAEAGAVYERLGGGGRLELDARPGWLPLIEKHGTTRNEQKALARWLAETAARR